MYKELKNYFNNDISNTIVFHNESNIDYIINTIKETVLPKNLKMYTDRSKDKTFLALKYPIDNHEIELFMDSPLNYVEYYKCFKGVFVIDLSNYVDNWKSSNIDKLIEYIRDSNKDMVFILLMNCSIADRERIFNRFDSKMTIDKFEVSSPHENELSEYLVNSIKARCYALPENIIPNLDYLFSNEYDLCKVTSFGDVDAIVNKTVRILLSNSNIDTNAILNEIKRYTENINTNERTTIGF